MPQFQLHADICVSFPNVYLLILEFMNSALLTLKSPPKLGFAPKAVSDHLQISEKHFDGN